MGSYVRRGRFELKPMHFLEENVAQMQRRTMTDAVASATEDHVGWLSFGWHAHVRLLQSAQMPRFEASSADQREHCRLM
jgi:hypothetical protein